MEQIKPQYIGRGPKTEKLYKLEEKAVESFRAAAEELVRVKHAHGLVEYELHKDAFPEQLACLCESISTDLGVFRTKE